MTGRILVIGLIAFTAIFAGALWWSLQRGWVREVSGVAQIEIAGAMIPVSDYRGVDGDSSPLKLRGCFRVDPTLVEAPEAPKPTPLVAPGWFDCFDAGAIEAALARGEARAVLAKEDELPQVDRVVAVFPDGRAYQWRQLAEGVEAR